MIPDNTASLFCQQELKKWEMWKAKIFEALYDNHGGNKVPAMRVAFRKSFLKLLVVYLLLINDVMIS